MNKDQPLRCLLISNNREQAITIASALEGSPLFESIKTVSSPILGIQLALNLHPDLVLLDVDIEPIGAPEVLAVLNGRAPQINVVGLFADTDKGRIDSLELSSLGAVDCIKKPESLNDEQSLRTYFVRRIQGLRNISTTTTKLTSYSPTRISTTTPEIVVVGVSTGGPNALAALIPMLPASFSVPIVIVQHIPDMYTPLLVERYGLRTPLNVGIAETGISPTSGNVWIAHGGRHLTITGARMSPRFALSDSPPENSCRPAADVLFRSAARIFGAATLGVVLTGMGSDGTNGSQAIKKAGGTVLVQDQKSSVVWGMPGSVVAAGLSDEIVPIEKMAQAITERCSKELTKPLSILGKA